MMPQEDANYILVNHCLTPDENFRISKVCPECGATMILYQTGELGDYIIGNYDCPNGHYGLWRKLSRGVKLDI